MDVSTVLALLNVAVELEPKVQALILQLVDSIKSLFSETDQTAIATAVADLDKQADDAYSHGKNL